MKTLVLCRHAKSDWPSGVADIDRPLKDRGIRNASFLGKLLGDQEFVPDVMISSPANRALSTARLVATEVGFARDAIEINRSVYFEGVSALLDTVRAVPDSSRSAMVFGHNPTMEEAVRHLLGAQAAFYMPTGAMACLESYSHSWQRFGTSNVHLRWFLIPRLKRKSE